MSGAQTGDGWQESDLPGRESFDKERAIVVVVGAHPLAEVGHRSAAYRMIDSMRRWLCEHEGDESDVDRAEPFVCTDVWYLNDAELRQRPTLSIGEPSLNALTAYLADKLPSAFVVDEVMTVQLDVTFEEATACVWGVSTEATEAAIELFRDRYLDGFMRAATGQS